MELNINKCSIISFSQKKKNILDLNYKFLNFKIQRTNLIKDQGVIFDTKMNFYEHITK